MNKTFIIVGVLSAVGVLFGVAVWLTGSHKPTPTSPSSTQNVGLPVAPAAQQITTVTVVTASSSGSGVQAIDFIHDPTTVKDSNNAGYYYLGYHTKQSASDQAATTSPPYLITYISATNYFNISLLQEPIGPVRAEAEQYLMSRLGISQSQMCQLDYMVSVPDRVNTQFSDRNLGFSFCPGATVLPK